MSLKTSNLSNRLDQEFLEYFREAVPESLWLPISVADQNKAWKKSQKHSHAIARYNAYVNCVCLSAFLEWLTEGLAETSDADQPLIWKGPDIHTFWEFINGTVILMGESRLVLIPSDPTETEDLCVPQEWVDIPNWTGDYYLAVQVNLDGDEDDCWIEVCGFATHRQLKSEGNYNSGDRTYCLPKEKLHTDILLIELTRGLHLQQEIEPLPNLSEVEAKRLLEYLGNSRLSSLSLRLTVSFEKWAALLDNDLLRQQLYCQRVPSVLQRLAKVFDTTWQEVENFLDNWEPQEPVNSFRGRCIESSENLQDGIKRVKRFNCQTPFVDWKLAVVATFTPETDEQIKIHFLVNSKNSTILPSNLRLMAIDEAGQAVATSQSQMDDNAIQLEFLGEQGDCFTIELALGEACITEDFELNY